MLKAISNVEHVGYAVHILYKTLQNDKWVFSSCLIIAIFFESIVVSYFCTAPLLLNFSWRLEPFNAKMGLAIKTHMWQAASVSEPSLYELGLLSYAVLNMKMVKATYDQDKQAVKNLCCLILENFVITECDSCCKERTA